MANETQGLHHRHQNIRYCADATAKATDPGLVDVSGTLLPLLLDVDL